MVWLQAHRRDFECWVPGWFPTVRERSPKNRLERTGAVDRRPPTALLAQPKLIATAEAPFLTALQQPLSLSPDATRTASFQVRPEGLALIVEAAPNFGPQGSSMAAAKPSDIAEGVQIIPRERLGVMGVRDVFWLSDRVFLITGYEGQTGKFQGWITDLNTAKATLISKPSTEASLFVPTTAQNRPFLRYDDQGVAEVLLGYATTFLSGPPELSWSWYSVQSTLLTDASDDPELPTRLWLEVIQSKIGIIEAVLLVNGTVARRTPEGWKDIGLVNRIEAMGMEEAAKSVLGQSYVPRQHLVSAAPDYGVFAVDTVSSTFKLPRAFPVPADLLVESDVGPDLRPAAGESIPRWVLRQCTTRYCAALVQLHPGGLNPTPLFMHPFADVEAYGVWLDPQTEEPMAVTVKDLKSRIYALTPESKKVLKTLREGLPKEFVLAGQRLSTEGMTPLYLERYGTRWMPQYSHPLLTESIALPALQSSSGPGVEWIGQEALAARGCALYPPPAALRPRISAHRLTVGGKDLSVYLLQPEAAPGGLVLRLQEAPFRRASWGVDGKDGWLLSRGYAILKVNYRGSQGFGRLWAEADKAAPQGFLEDLEAALHWALKEEKVLGDAGLGASPPVAVMGSYSSGFAALLAAAKLPSLIACAVAVAPKQTSPPSGGVSPLADLTKALLDKPVLVLEYEKDSPDARDWVLEALAPAGQAPEEWPKNLQFVQYAGEGAGGGLVRQNLLDQYRRIDHFLWQKLSPLTKEGALLTEPFVEELPFLSASLNQGRSGALSSYAEQVEQNIEVSFRKREGKKADEFPSLRPLHFVGGKGKGFSDQAETKMGKRTTSLVAPNYRLLVQKDGNVEVTVHFAKEPEGLYALMIDAYLHIRAKDFGFTLALPREPLPAQDVSVQTKDGKTFVFTVPGDPGVGAIENFQRWQKGGCLFDVISALRPKDMERARRSSKVDKGEAEVVA